MITFNQIKNNCHFPNPRIAMMNLWVVTHGQEEDSLSLAHPGSPWFADHFSHAPYGVWISSWTFLGFPHLVQTHYQMGFSSLKEQVTCFSPFPVTFSFSVPPFLPGREMVSCHISALFCSNPQEVSSVLVDILCGRTIRELRLLVLLTYSDTITSRGTILMEIHWWSRITQSTNFPWSSTSLLI